MQTEQRNLLAALGPGLLFAGAAIGVSHLVQSTRAGAAFGLTLVGAIVVANALKYPAFSFGPRYAAATGQSLLAGYRRQGVWALALYLVVTVATMFTVEAAVAFVTAALAVTLLGLPWSPWTVTAAILLLCAGTLAAGGFRWLDRIMKVVVAALTVGTVVATALALPRVDFAGPWWPSAEFFSDPSALLFTAALVGWMPSAIDISVWHSLWTLARKRDTGHAPSVRESLLDFNIGYVGTAALAICFVLLGAAVGSGQPLPAGAGPFAARIIELYTSTLGEWSRYLIGGCALMVMFSTTLTVVDGFPRALTALWCRLSSRDPRVADVGTEPRALYWGAVAVLAAGALVILRWFIGNLTDLVDLATTLSFVTAPVLALLNHRAVLSSDVPIAHRPGRAMVWFSAFCVAALAAFALAFLYLRFG